MNQELPYVLQTDVMVAMRDGVRLATDVYLPAISREQVSRRSLDDILSRFFGGSARALVSQLLDSEELDPEEIKAIRTELNRRLKG